MYSRVVHSPTLLSPKGTATVAVCRMLRTKRCRTVVTTHPNRIHSKQKHILDLHFYPGKMFVHIFHRFNRSIYLHRENAIIVTKYTKKNTQIILKRKLKHFRNIFTFLFIWIIYLEAASGMAKVLCSRLLVNNFHKTTGFLKKCLANCSFPIFQQWCEISFWKIIKRNIKQDIYLFLIIEREEEYRWCAYAY